MLLIQLLLISFFIFALSRVFLKFRSKDIKIGSAFFWFLVWLSSVLVVFDPNITVYLAKMLGVGRGVDAVLYIAVAALFFMLFRIWIRVEKMEKNITELVRKEALNKNKIS